MGLNGSTSKRVLMAAMSFALIVLVAIAPGRVLLQSLLTSGTDSGVLLSVPTVRRMKRLLVRGDNKLFYALASYSGWFWSDNYITVISRNGWTGNVNLQTLNLPSGVTSEMPTTVFVPRYGSATVPIQLRSAIDAPLATATVTLRATSGSIVKTGDVQFAIVDQLPPLPA
jgi:hypothetical protein